MERLVGLRQEGGKLGLTARLEDLLDSDGFLGAHQVAKVFPCFRLVAAFVHANLDHVADGGVEGENFDSKCDYLTLDK